MSAQNDDISLVGYYPGVLGRITELHATYYWKNWNFDVTFETQVASELAQFLTEFKKDRDGLWVAEINGEIVGAVAVDGNIAGPDQARLRWFIVDPAMQGRGVGAALIREAVEFARSAGFRSMFLWTFKGLESARTLYERAGFTLTEDCSIDKWGSTIYEQRYDLAL